MYKERVLDRLTLVKMDSVQYRTHVLIKKGIRIITVVLYS